MPSTDDPENFRPQNEAAVFRTIKALLMQHQMMKCANDMDDATNTTNNNNNNNNINEKIDDDDGFVDGSVQLRGIRRIPNSLNFDRRRKSGSVQFQLPEEERVVSSSDESTLTEIIEECEYDSDIGKFKCKDDDSLVQDEDSENSCSSSMVENFLEIENLNNLNSPPKFEIIAKPQFNANNFKVIEDDPHYKIVMKRVEFFESVTCEKEKCEKMTNLEISPTREEEILSKILLMIFILTVTIIIYFPLPN